MFRPKSPVRAGILVLLFAVCEQTLFADLTITAPRPVSGRAATVDQLLPADVLARVRLVRDELELIRLELGRPVCSESVVIVSDAEPREVYSQSKAMLRKLNRLAFEHTGLVGDEPDEPPVQKIRPFHVWSVTNVALERVLRIKKHLAIPENCVEVRQPDETTPTDVFREIIRIGRQVNLLLDARMAPADVFEQVTNSVGHVSRMLAISSSSVRIPSPPAFERRKTPKDAIQRLSECHKQLSRIARISKLHMLTLELKTEHLDAVHPGDVYDVALLVLSEVEYLHSQCNDVDVAPKTFFPGPKTPSHVYQRIGILQQQLELLERIATENPDWCKGRNTRA